MRFFIFCVFISILNPILAEPTCSREDKVYFLNGVNNTTQEAVDNLSKLKIILKDEKNNKKVSKNKLLDKNFKLLYNTKLGVADFAEVLALKLEEIGTKDPWDVAGKIFFKSATYSKKEIEEDFGSSLKYLNPSDVKWQLLSAEDSPYNYYVTIDLEDQQEYTISQLGNIVKNDLISGSKAIVISHSQGGLITNKVYDYLFRDGVQSQDFEEKYEPYFANAQFGTAAGSIRTDPSGSDYVTLDTDNVVGVLSEFGQTLGLRTLLPNYRIDTSKSPFGQLVDFLKGHSFSSVYAGDLFIHGGGTLDSKMASEVFIETLASAVSKMPPNCCFKYENGEYKISNEELVPYHNGFISPEIVTIPSSLKLYGASICSGVKIGENVTLRRNVVVSGNVELRNCQIQSYDFNGASLEIIGAGGNGVLIEGPATVDDGLNPGSGLRIFSNEGNLRITGSTTEITERGDISSNGNSSIDNTIITLSTKGPGNQPALISFDSSSFSNGTTIIYGDPYYSVISGGKSFSNCDLISSTFYSTDGTHSCINSRIVNSAIFNLDMIGVTKNDNYCDPTNVNDPAISTSYDEISGITTTCYNPCYYPRDQAGCYQVVD